MCSAWFQPRVSGVRTKTSQLGEAYVIENVMCNVFNGTPLIHNAYRVIARNFLKNHKMAEKRSKTFQKRSTVLSASEMR